MKSRSYTAGTRCLKGQHLVRNGTVLNDCHAEIVSRRCFKRLLFEQIAELMKGNQSTLLDEYTIVQPNQTAASMSRFQNRALKRYRLRPGIRFHLYVSLTPCGDAAQLGTVCDL